MDSSYCGILLQNELNKRKDRNEYYSLRAFARDLNIGSTTLSDVLANKRLLSKSNIIKITEKLALSPIDIHELNLERLGKKTKESNEELKRLELQEREFRLISEWYYIAILNLAKLTHNKSSAKWVANRLNIKEVEAKIAISTLKDLELIVTKNGKMCRTAYPISSSRDIPSRAIKKYHQGNLIKAQEILGDSNISVEKREFSSTTMLIDPKQLQKAKNLMMKTKRKIAEILESGNPSQVYTLSFQLFPLEKGKQKENS